MDGLDGTRVWCGWGILAHNSVKVGRLLEEKPAAPARPTTPRSPWAKAKSPPPTPAEAA